MVLCIVFADNDGASTKDHGCCMIRISDDAAEAALEFLKRNAPKHAAGRASRIWSEKNIKVVWAEVFLTAEAKTVAEKEAIAEASGPYKEALAMYRICVEQDELNRDQADAAKLQIEIWRTEQANNRRGF